MHSHRHKGNSKLKTHIQNVSRHFELFFLLWWTRCDAFQTDVSAFPPDGTLLLGANKVHIHIQNQKIFDKFGIFGTCRYFRQILSKRPKCRNNFDIFGNFGLFDTLPKLPKLLKMFGFWVILKVHALQIKLEYRCSPDCQCMWCAGNHIGSMQWSCHTKAFLSTSNSMNL